MTNNDIFRSLRFTFGLHDEQSIKVFKLGGLEVEQAQVRAWLAKEEDEDFEKMHDIKLATFLNGIIVKHRGRKKGAEMLPEKRLNNNLILRKLKIALELKDDDILALLESVDFRLSRHELSAFFRKPDHRHFRMCKDQVLRSFLRALSLQKK